MNKKQHEMIDMQQIKKIAAEQKTPFPYMLSGYFMEYVFKKFICADWQGILWHKNLYNMGLDSYRKRIQDKLAFYLVSEEISFQIQDKMVQTFQDVDEDNVLNLWSITENDDIHVDISIKWERYQIPVKVKIFRLPTSEILPDEKMFVSSFVKEPPIPYRQFPIDIQIAENIIEIFEKLELVNDMEVFYSLSQILSQNTINGRKIYNFFVEYLREEDITKWIKKWDDIRGYKAYHYMQKKWSTYLKKIRAERLPWESVITMLDSFFTPIWQAIENDVIFFGDWMPDLQRYLD